MQTIETPDYRPYMSGKYKVEPGLAPLERDVGLGPLDTKVFQFTPDTRWFLTNKLECLKEDPSKYIGYADPLPETLEVVGAMLRAQLFKEWGIGVSEDNNARNSFQALAMAVPEDICIIQVEKDGSDRLVAAHVCAPSGWDPRQKLGKSFREIHEPVGDIAKIRAQAPSLVQALVRGRYKRFGWGIRVDNRLNHHPEPPAWFPGSMEDWYGRGFDPDNPSLFVRIERQTLVGLPEVSAFVFTIRIYLQDVHGMDTNERLQLAKALQSMSPQTRKYKCLENNLHTIVSWLEQS